MSSSRKNIPLSDLCFYFDGVHTDRQDQGGVGRRNAEILAIRERLLKLGDHEFDAVMKTLSNMIQTKESQDRQQAGDELAKRRAEEEAKTLFSAINDSHAQQTSIDEVPKV